MVRNPPGNAGDTGSVPGGRAKIPQATQYGQKTNKTKNKRCRLGDRDEPCARVRDGGGAICNAGDRHGARGNLGY